MTAELAEMKKIYEELIAKMEDVHEKQLKEKDEEIERQKRCIDARGHFATRVHQKNKVLKEEINRLKGN